MFSALFEHDLRADAVSRLSRDRCTLCGSTRPLRSGSCSYTSRPKAKRNAVAHAASKRRRRAGADHLAGLVADAAESMRAATLEIIGIARTQDAPLAID